MRKVFLDELPRWEKGGNKGKINWSECVGLKIPFEYDEIKSEFEVVDYKKQTGYLTIKYWNREHEIYNGNFMKCQFGKILGKKTKDFLYKVGDVLKDKERDLIIIDRTYIEDKNGRKRKHYKYKCNICGFDCGNHYRKGEYKEEYWIEESALKGGTGCSCCKNISIVPDINSIWKKNRWMIDLGVNENDAKRYSCSNGNKIEVICPDCEKIKMATISKVYDRKSIGCSCGDGFSKGHKYIRNVLEQLDVEFLENFSPNWCSFEYKNKIRYGEYDFILEDRKLIIEVDGGFHRKDNSMSGQTKEDSKFIDSEKDRLAYENNYKMIRVYYNDDYIMNKESIMDSKMPLYFDLSNVSWERATEFSLSNLVKEVCLVWKSKYPNVKTIDIALEFNLSQATICKYLSIGDSLEWCNYNPKEERRKAAINMSKATSKKVIVLKGDKVVGVFPSASALERESINKIGVRLLQSAVSRVCNGEKSQYKGFVFKYAEENIE